MQTEGSEQNEADSQTEEFDYMFMPAGYQAPDQEYFDSYAKVRFYTGLPSYEVLMVVFEHVSSHVSRQNQNLSRFQEFVMVLIKLRKSTTGETIRVDSIESTRIKNIFTLHSSPEVKICEIMLHEPSSFLKRGHKPQSIRTIHVDSIESSRIDNIFNPPLKSRSTIFSHTNRLPACRIDRKGKDSCRFDEIGFMNRFPVC